MSYALITGASKGIGKAIATILAKKNIDVLLVARSGSLLKELAEQLSDSYKVKAHYFAADLSVEGATQQVINWLTDNNYGVHILVNNAGYGLSGLFEKYSLEEHKSMMQVNMSVPVELTHKLLPQMRNQPQSYILNIASSAAYQAVPGLSLYAGSKAFILNFSRGLQYELRKTNISVTVISPGATDTDFAHRAKVGANALKTAEKVNMTPEKVAEIAVDAMFAKKTEVVTGFINKLGAFLVWALPKKIAEKIAADLYGL